MESFGPLKIIEKVSLKWIENMRKLIEDKNLKPNLGFYIKNKEIKNKTKVEYTLLGSNYSHRMPSIYLEDIEESIKIELPWIDNIIKLLENVYSTDLLLWYVPNKIRYFKNMKDGRNIFNKTYKTLIREAQKKGVTVRKCNIEYYKTPLPEFIKKLRNKNAIIFKDYFIKGYLGLNKKEDPEFFYLLKDYVDTMSAEIDENIWSIEELNILDETKKEIKRGRMPTNLIFISEPISKIVNNDALNEEEKKRELSILLKLDSSKIDLVKLKKVSKEICLLNKYLESIKTI